MRIFIEVFTEHIIQYASKFKTTIYHHRYQYLYITQSQYKSRYICS